MGKRFIHNRIGTYTPDRTKPYGFGTGKFAYKRIEQKSKSHAFVAQTLRNTKKATRQAAKKAIIAMGSEK